MEVIVKYNGDIKRLEQELGVQVENLEYNYAIITLKPEQLKSLYNYTEIEYIEFPKTVSFNLEQELRSVCLPTLENSTYNLTGRGTIVGIIDSGIDYNHSDFKNEDGSSRILFIWDQTGEGTPPAGFKSGVEFVPDEVIDGENDVSQMIGMPEISGPNFDTTGHGTAVAGIACRKWKSKRRSTKRSCKRRKYYCSKTWQKRSGIVCKNDPNYESIKICNK